MAIIRIDVDGKNATATLRKIRKDFKNLDSTIEKTTKRTSLFSGALGKMAIALGGTYVAYKSLKGIFSLGSGFVQTASQFETFETTLKSITGSSTQAKESMDWIADFTSKTPYQLNQVTNAFIKLKAYGIDPTDETLKTLGDTASAMGKPLIQAVEAMADAMVGENERLKEFGLRASKMGNQIGYEWTDSSGKTRNIIIENNREIIKSTLNAIFNEKYMGAMDAQSRTWTGIMSNMSDKWTMFQKNVMDKGLFTYLKSGAIEASKELSKMFDSGEGSAKGFSEFVINGFNNIIRGAGYASDAITIFNLGIATIQTTFATVGYYITEGFQTIANAGASATNAIIKFWVGLTNRMGAAWHSLVNWVLSTWNSMVSGIANSGIGKLMSEKFGMDFGRMTAEITPFKAAMVETVASAKDFSAETKYWGDSMNSGFVEMQKLSGEIGMGAEKAEMSIARIKQGVVELRKEEAHNNKEREKANELLKKMGADYGALPTSSSGGGGGGGGAAKKLKKDLKAAEKEAKKFTGAFTGLFDKMLSGDWSNLFQDFFGSIGKTMMKPFIDDMSKQLSEMLSKFTSGLGNLGGFLMGAGLSLLGNLLGSLFNSEVSQQEIDAAKGQTEWNDESIANMESMFESVMYPQLSATNTMSKYLKSIDENTAAFTRALVGKASTAGIDLTGANFVETMESGFLGFSSKSISLIGSGLKIDMQKLGEAIDETRIQTQAYTTTLVKKSSWWGLSKSSKIVESMTDLPDSVKRDLASSMADGYYSIVAAAAALGYDEKKVADALLAADLKIGKDGKIDFTGLSQTEINSRLQAVFSESFSMVIDSVDMFDDIIGRFAKGSEDQMETLLRIATEFEQASFSFELIGKSFADVDGRTVSLNTKLGDWGDTLDNLGVSLDIVSDAYTAQYQILDVVAGAGGLEAFNEGFSAYVDGFFTDQEKLDMTAKSLGISMNNLGKDLPTFKDAEEARAWYRAQVEGWDTTTQAGAEALGGFMTLADGFNSYADQIENLNGALIAASGEMLQHYKDLRLGSLSTLSLQQKAAFATVAFKQEADTNTLWDNINSMLETQSRADSDFYAYKAKENEALARLSNEVTIDKDQRLIDKLEETVTRQEDKLDSIIGLLSA